MSEFVDDLPLDGPVLIRWADRDAELGIYKGYLASNPQRCAVRLADHDSGYAAWIDRAILEKVDG